MTGGAGAHDPSGPFPLLLVVVTECSRLSPARRPMTPGTLRVVDGSLSEGLPVGVGELAHDPARNTRDQYPGWQPGAGQNHSPGRNQRARADSGATEHDCPDADQRAGFYMCAVHGRVVAKADPVFEHGRLTWIDVQAAQILDIALGAHDYFLVVRAQHGPVGR